jgi:hypothetical protein
MNNENCTHCASGLGCHYHSIEWANRRITELIAERDEARELIRQKVVIYDPSCFCGVCSVLASLAEAAKSWEGEKG